jgi:UDP-GlcNAc:undecaprenyl-phosphate GlcNAc-1-phosphate transferase
MDALILFVAVVMPYFPNPYVESMQMGIMATRIVVLIFSYEVLIGELRGHLRGQTMMAAGALLVIAAKGIFS